MVYMPPKGNKLAFNFTEDPPNLYGFGTLSGSFPLSMLTNGGNLPSHAEIRVLYRPNTGDPGDGVVVSTATCNADGTWQVSGLDESLKFDIVARIPGFNDVIISDVQPTGAPLTAHFANLKEEYEYQEEVEIQLVALGGKPPYTFTAVELPEGLSIDPNTGYITGSMLGKLDLVFEVEVKDSENTVVNVAGSSYTEGDPHWDNVVALLHFDGDLTDETGRVWGTFGSPTFEYVSPIYGTGSFKTNGNDAAETANHELINNNNDPYCIEFTFKAVSLDTFGVLNPLFWCYSNGPYGDSLIGINSSSGLRVQLHSGANSWIIAESLAPITIGVKYHLAITYDGSDLRVFLDGVLVYIGVGIKIQTPTKPMRFGTAAEGRYMQGSNHIYDELRITKGVAHYTENFTPPTEPFPSY